MDLPVRSLAKGVKSLFTHTLVTHGILSSPQNKNGLKSFIERSRINIKSKLNKTDIIYCQSSNHPIQVEKMILNILSSWIIPLLSASFLFYVQFIHNRYRSFSLLQ